LAGVIGKPALFSLTNSWATFYQVGTHRKPDAMKNEFYGLDPDRWVSLGGCP
jgi:hypothetical protein